MDLQSAADLS